MFKKILFTWILGFLFISSSFAWDFAWFTVKVNHSNVKVWQAVDLDIKAVDNDWNVVQDYQWDILIVVKDGDNELSPDDYSVPNDGTYSFTEHDMWEKIFIKWLIINKKWCFKVHIEDFDTAKFWDAYIGVWQKCDITLLSWSKKIKLSSSKNTKQVIHSKIIINEKSFKISNEYNEINRLIDSWKLKQALNKFIQIYPINNSTRNLNSLLSDLLDNFDDEVERSSILLEIDFIIKNSNNLYLTNMEKKLLIKLINKIENLPTIGDLDYYLTKNETKITLLPKYKKVLTKLWLWKVVQKIDNFTKNFFNKYKDQETINSKLSQLFTKIAIARYKIENLNLNKKKKNLIKWILSYLKLSLIKWYVENKKKITENTEWFTHISNNILYIVKWSHMLPNYKAWEKVFVNKNYKILNRWDVVVEKPEFSNISFFERIVWSPWEIIEIKSWSVYLCKTSNKWKYYKINDVYKNKIYKDSRLICKQLKESYIEWKSINLQWYPEKIHTEPKCGVSKFILWTWQYLLFWDNRMYSTDSRCCFIWFCSNTKRYYIKKSEIIWKVK